MASSSRAARRSAPWPSCRPWRPAKARGDDVDAAAAQATDYLVEYYKDEINEEVRTGSRAVHSRSQLVLLGLATCVDTNSWLLRAYQVRTGNAKSSLAAGQPDAKGCRRPWSPRMADGLAEKRDSLRAAHLRVLVQLLRSQPEAAKAGGGTGVAAAQAADGCSEQAGDARRWGGSLARPEPDSFCGLRRHALPFMPTRCD